MIISRPNRLARAVITAGLALTLGALPLVGCAAAETSASNTAATRISTASALSTTDIEVSDAAASAVVAEDSTTSALVESGMFTERDLTGAYDAEDVMAIITLSDSGSSASGTGVTIEGSTITITEAGTYIIRGTLTDGQIVVDAADDAKVQLLMEGASISTSGAAAIYVANADKVFLTLEAGTENYVSASGAAVEYDGSTVDGAIYSKDDLVINGTGTLEVTSAAGCGIVAKDDLKLAGATVSVSAYDHAIDANDSVRIASGEWSLSSATADGIHVENSDDTTEGWVYIAGGTTSITAATDGVDASATFTMDAGTLYISAGDDGLHAEYDVVINDGTVAIAKSHEGVEGSTITVNGGYVLVVADDDGFNAAGDPNSTAGDMMADSTAWLLIAGGVVEVQSQGDGLDSNGAMYITGGEVYVSGPTGDGDGSLDTGDGAEASITGGTVIAVGSTGMAESFSASSEQGSILVSLSGNAGDTVSVYDSDGNLVASYTPSSSYACVNVSVPGMAAGETYTISNGSSSVTVTLTATTYSDVQTGMGGMGGMDAMGGMGGMGGGFMG